MRVIFTILILSALCLASSSDLLIQAGSAQNIGNFKSVGGDFGRSWINNFLAQNKPAQTTEDLKNDLWSWGGSPMGTSIVNGKLVQKPYATSTLNVSANWLGDSTFQTQPLVLNGTTPTANYGTTGAPLTPLYLSDDPWILAQQLERPVVTVSDYGAALYPSLI